VREADPAFVRALELMRDVQAAGGIGMRVDEDKAKGQTAVLFFRRDDLEPGVTEKAAEVRRLLGLPAGQEKFVLTYSPVRGGEGELAVSSRSMLQVMAAFASYMDVPEAHLQDHSATPSFEHLASDDRSSAVQIHSGKEKPASSFAAVHYRDHWFWIDNGDWQTKRALTAVMFFFTLAERSSTMPYVTDDNSKAMQRIPEIEQRLQERYVPRDVGRASFPADLIKVVLGPRRAGKSFFAMHLVRDLGPFGYVNFDDERLADMTDADALLVFKDGGTLATESLPCVV
jgi:hypothetical protein